MSPSGAEGGEGPWPPSHLQEDLDGLGAGDTRGPTGDVLGDNAKGPVGGAIASTVVLGRQETAGRSGSSPAACGAGQGGAGTAYLGQCVLAAALEAVPLAIEGEEVAVPVGRAGAQAGPAAALPLAVPAGATRGRHGHPAHGPWRGQGQGPPLPVKRGQRKQRPQFWQDRAGRARGSAQKTDGTHGAFQGDGQRRASALLCLLPRTPGSGPAWASVPVVSQLHSAHPTALPLRGLEPTSCYSRP